MKRIFIVSLVILLVGGMAMAATPGRDLGHGPGDVLGQGGLASDPGKIFRLVRYVDPNNSVNASTLTADSIVIWDTVSDDGVTVTTTTTSGDNAVAGIIVANALTPETLGNTAFADVSKRNWTWLQTYGLSKVIVEQGAAIAVKSVLGTSTQPGKANTFVFGTVDAGVRGNAATALNAATGSGNTTVAVFLKLD